MTSPTRGKLPVAQAFDEADRGTSAFLHHALELIHRVHTCGTLPRVAFRHIPYPVESEYRPTIPPQIVIDAGGQHKLAATIHAIGHMIDQFGFGTGEYGVFETRKLRDGKYNGPLREWWIAVQATATVKMLHYALGDPGKLKAIVTAKRAEVIPDKADLNYLLTAEELWARSYVQYIAAKTRDAELTADLQFTLSTPAFALLDHWPEAEFAAVEAQIDALFGGLGWRES